MRRHIWLAGLILVVAGCAPSVNLEQERTALLAADRDWSQTTKDTEKFLSFVAADASVYAPGMPLVKGTADVRKMFGDMSKTPGFSLSWTASKAEVSAAGDVGYTTGAYQMTMGGPAEKGKYVTVWKKQAGAWKVVEDIFNADAVSEPPASKHVMVAPASVTFGEAPPSLPKGARLAVIAGDPSQPLPFTIRLQMPAGYKIGAHWHPTDENVTVLSGTIAVGMGNAFEASALSELAVGGYVTMPAKTPHFAMAKTAVTLQVHGVGPFILNYVNAADDPSKQKP